MKKDIIVTLENAKKVTGVHYTIKHTGKMAGMQSLSTSNLCNPFCAAHKAVKGSICEKCYADTQLRRWSTMQNPLAKNFEILTSRILSDEELPLINSSVFRFEAFGDIYNEIQVANYFNICNKNPHVNFALWTKNPAVIDRTIKMGFKKPENIVILLSSLYVNVIADASKFPFIDKVFTVYDVKTIASENIDINCGARSCLACQRCYHKDNGEFFINEKLK